MHEDVDPIETQEWLEALESVLEYEGVERASYLLTRLSERATREGTQLPLLDHYPFRNTFP